MPRRETWVCMQPPRADEMPGPETGQALLHGIRPRGTGQRLCDRDVLHQCHVNPTCQWLQRASYIRHKPAIKKQDGVRCSPKHRKTQQVITM